MPVYRLVGTTWEKKQNIFVALDPSKLISDQFPKITAKLSLSAENNNSVDKCRFFACDDSTGVPQKEIDPTTQSLTDAGIAEKGCLYVMTSSDDAAVRATVTTSASADASPSTTEQTVTDSDATSKAAEEQKELREKQQREQEQKEKEAQEALEKQKAEQEEEEERKRREQQEQDAALELMLKEKEAEEQREHELQQQQKEQERQLQLQKEQEEKAAAAAEELRKQQEQQEREEAEKKEKEQQQEEEERRRKQKQLQEEEEAQRLKKEEEEKKKEQEQEQEPPAKSYFAEEREAREAKRKEDELVAERAAASKKKEEETAFKKELDRKEMQKRKNEAEELERKRIMAEAASERKKREEEAKKKYANEKETSSLPTKAPIPISRVSYSHRSLDFEMLFLQEELDRQKIANAMSRELYNSLTATTLMSRSWHVSEKTPMLEAMRLYAKTLTQRISLVQGAHAVRWDRELENHIVEEDWHREYAQDLRKMYDDVCQEVVNLRAVTSKSSWEAHQAVIRRTNAEQSEFVALEKLRMETHLREHAESKLEEAESRLKDVETRNMQLVSVVERLGENLFNTRNNSNNNGGDANNKSRSVGILLSESSTAQTAPGATSVVHCVDDVPDHVLSTTIQIERRWFEKDDKVRELTSALSSEKYKAKEAFERQREAEEQCEAAVKNNSQMQSSLKDAIALTKSWETKYTEADRMQKNYLVDINKQREQIAKLQQELRTVQGKCEANEAAIIGITIERDRAREQVERQKGELQAKSDEMEKKHALIVNLETRETELREHVAPFEKRVRELTSSLSQATELTQKLQKELDKRDQSLQKLRNHLASVTGFAGGGSSSRTHQNVGAENDTSNNNINSDNNNEHETVKPIFHNKPLGFLGLPNNSSTSTNRIVPSSSPSHTPINNNNNRSGVYEQLMFSPPSSQQQNQTPKRTTARQIVSTSQKRASTPRVTTASSQRAITPGRTPVALIYQHQLDKAEGKVAALLAKDQQVGERAVNAAAGSKIAQTLERLQKDLTDTEIELSKETKLRAKLEQQLEVARRGVDELTRINVELREHNQQSLEDAINFFAGAGGAAMRSAIQEVYAYKEIMLENEQLKNANIYEHKRVATLEVRCQVLERHLEALAKGGSPGVEGLPQTSSSSRSRRNLSPRVAAATRKFETPTSMTTTSTTKPTSSGDVFITSPQKAAIIEQNKLRELQVAFDDLEDDAEEAAFKDDPQLLALIRDARRRQRLADGLPSVEEEEEELERQRRARIEAEKAKENPVLHVDVISPTRHRSPLNIYDAKASGKLLATQRTNAVVDKQLQSQKARLLREQNLELEAKIKKLDDWRSAVLDTEALAFERGSLGMTSGRGLVVEEANRLAHSPPRDIMMHHHSKNNNYNNSSSNSASRHGTPTSSNRRNNIPGGVISKTGRDAAYW